MRELATTIKLALPVLLMAIGAGWLGDSLYNALLGEITWTRVLFFTGIGGGIFFLLGAFWLYRQRKEYLPVRALERMRDIRPRKVLISTISPKGRQLELDIPDDKEVPASVKDARTTVTLSGNVEEDAAPCEIRWSWQQLLRAIVPHKETLERVYLVGSSDKEGSAGSHNDLKACRRLLKRYLPEACTVTFSDTGVDFEDIDALTGRFKDILAELQREGYCTDEVMIDSTGGMKTTSIAAAMVTLDHPRLHFQYVPTQGDDFRPFAFNVVAETQPELG